MKVDISLSPSGCRWSRAGSRPPVRKRPRQVLSCSVQKSLNKCINIVLRHFNFSGQRSHSQLLTLLGSQLAPQWLDQRPPLPLPWKSTINALCSALLGAYLNSTYCQWFIFCQNLKNDCCGHSNCSTWQGDMGQRSPRYGSRTQSSSQQPPSPSRQGWCPQSRKHGLISPI